jgi:hypothetical protein
MPQTRKKGWGIFEYENSPTIFAHSPENGSPQSPERRPDPGQKRNPNFQVAPFENFTIPSSEFQRLLSIDPAKIAPP